MRVNGMSVISAHSSDWRPVRLQDDSSVEYLNELFSEGWFLMPLGVDGLAALAFSVPAEPVRESAHQMVWSRETPHMADAISVMVLRRGDAPMRQQAVVTRRDDEGYFDMRGLPRMPGWHWVATVHLETDELVTVLERDEFSETTNPAS